MLGEGSSSGSTRSIRVSLTSFDRTQRNSCPCFRPVRYLAGRKSSELSENGESRNGDFAGENKAPGFEGSNARGRPSVYAVVFGAASALLRLAAAFLSSSSV